jgi:phenylpyruvate tautomerase PptA (4-oxalocrotonate tautomerase family)
MPVVTIQALNPKDEAKIDTTLAKVVNDLAAAIGTVPTNIWANFTPMAAVREGDLKDYHTIITVLANPRPEESIRKGLKAVADAVSTGLGVKMEKVWIRWVDLPPGRVFADGVVK